MKKVIIKFKPQQETEFLNIPVIYKTVKESNRLSHFCKVDLTESEVPEWLLQTEFECFIIFKSGSAGRPGVTVSNTNPLNSPNVNTALFKIEVETTIASIEGNPFILGR